MRTCFYILILALFPTFATAQTAKNNSEAVEAGNESNVNLGEQQIIAGGDVTYNNFSRTEYEALLQRKIIQLEGELAQERATSGVAQEDVLQKRRELDETRSKLADSEASYAEKLDELQTLQELLASLGPEADRERVVQAQEALQNGDTTAAIALANELRDDKAGDVDAAASAEFILGAALETDLRWFEADPHYQRAADLHPNARRLEKACGSARIVDDLPRARRYCTERIAHVEKEYGKAAPEMAEALADLAMIEDELGDVVSAQEHFGTAIVISKSLSDENGRLIHAENLARYGDFLVPLGKFREAEGTALEALAITEEILGTEHRDVAERLATLGELYMSVLDAQKAAEVLKRSVDITQSTLGPTDPDYAIRLLDYADALHTAGSIDTSAAITMATEALNIIKQTLGADHYEYGRALQHHAGYLWADSGDARNALEMGEQALGIIRASRGDASAVTISALKSVASFALGAGDYDYAKRVIRKALDAARETYGPDSLIAGRTHDILGAIYGQLGDYDKAEAEVRKARAIFRATLGENSVEFASASLSLAVVLLDTSRPREALALARAGYETKRAILGDASALTAIQALLLGTIYNALGETDMGMELAETARSTIENAWGPDHALWAVATQTLGVAHVESGNYATGAELLRAALEVSEEKSANPNQDFVIRFNIVLALAFDNKTDEAIEEAEALKHYTKSQFEATDQNNGLAHRATGIAYKEAGDLDAAEQEFRAAIAILDDLGNVGATHRVMSKVALSQILSEQRRTQDAAYTMEQAADTAEEIFGPDHQWTFGLRRQTAQAFVSIHKYNEAETILSELLTRTEEQLGRLSDEHWQVVNLRAWLERSRGVTSDSVPFHEERLALAIEKFGAVSEQRIVSLKLLAIVHKDLGEMEVANTHVAEALELAHANLPAGHAEIAQLMSMQRILARANGKFLSVVDLAKKEVVFARQHAEERPADWVKSLNSLGDALSQIDADLEARAAYEEAIDIAENLETDSGFMAGVSITDLGHLEKKLGNLRDAERHFEDALDLLEDLGGADHDAYPIALRNLATAKLQMNDIADAREMHAELLAVTAERHGVESQQYAQALLSRGSVSLRSNDLTAAETDINRALEILTSAKTPQDELEDAQAIKASLLIAKGRTNEAAAILEEHAAEVEETDADLRFNSYAARDRLAWLLFESGKVKRARDLAAEQLVSLESAGLTKGWYFLSAQALQSVVAVVQGDREIAESFLDAVTALAEQRHEVETTQHMLADEARMYVTYAFGDKARASIDRALLEDRANRLLGAINPERKRLQSRIEFVLAEAAELSSVSAEEPQ